MSLKALSRWKRLPVLNVRFIENNLGGVPEVICDSYENSNKLTW